MSKKFAIIFIKETDASKQENYIYFESTHIIEENGTYQIDKKIEDFGIITGDSKFIVSSGIELHMSEEKEYMVYIFDDEYMTECSRKFEPASLLHAEEFIEKKARKVILTKSKFRKNICTSLIKSSTIHNDDLMVRLGTEAAYVLTHTGRFVVNQYASEMLETALAKKQKTEYTGITDLDIDRIIQEISEDIIGQEEAITQLLCNIQLNQLVLNKEGMSAVKLDSRKIGILLEGETGTGKTAIVKSIAEKLNIPVEIVNANSFSETGYVGADLTAPLSRLLEKAEGDLELAERSIIIFDEVDKIARKFEHDSTSMKLGVQQELLGFISGSNYTLPANRMYGVGETTFNTSKLTFIFAGSFTDMIERLKKKANSQIGIRIDDPEQKGTYTVDIQDYVDYGLIRDFIARIKVPIYLRPYTKEDMIKILCSSKISPLSSFKETCADFGYSDVVFTDEFIEAIAQRAVEMKTNARALQTIVAGIQNLLLYQIMTSKFDKESPLVIGTDILERYEAKRKRKI